MDVSAFMNSDEWLVEQQRQHNYQSFSRQLPPLKPVRAKRQPFTIEQLLVAERWANKQKERT